MKQLNYKNFLLIYLQLFIASYSIACPDDHYETCFITCICVPNSSVPFKQIENARIEANAQTYAPILEQWLIASRESTMAGDIYSIPSDIRNELEGFYSSDILDLAAYKVGDSGLLNLASLSIEYGDASAVTLIDVIVFYDEYAAENDVELWVHELEHVSQFKEWGTRDFSIRYLRSWNSVENSAKSQVRKYREWVSNGKPVIKQKKRLTDKSAKKFNPF